MEQGLDHHFWRGHPRSGRVNSPFMDEPHGMPTVILNRAKLQNTTLVVDDDRNFCIKLLQKNRNLINKLSGRRYG